MSKTKQALFDQNHPSTWVKGDGAGLSKISNERTQKLFWDLYNEIMGAVIPPQGKNPVAYSEEFVRQAVRDKLAQMGQ